MASDADRGLNGQLWALVEALRREGTDRISVGPDEVITANRLLLELAAQGVSSADWDFKDYRGFLTPVFAKTREQRALFGRVFDEVAVPEGKVVKDADQPPEVSPKLPEKTQRERLKELLADKNARKPALSLVAVLAMLTISFLVLNWSSVPKPSNIARPTPSTTQQTTPTDTPTASLSAPPAFTPLTSSPMERLLSSSKRHDGAPTLAEIAHDLASTAPVPMRDEEYLRRLQDLTGMQPHRPLQLSIFDGGPKREGALPELAWAIGEIEIPGRNPSLAEHAQNATNDNVIRDALGRVSRLADDLGEVNFSVSPDASAMSALNELAFKVGDIQKTEANCSAENNNPVQNSVAKMQKGNCDLRQLITAQLASIALARKDLSPSAQLRAVSIAHPEWHPATAPWLPEPIKTPLTPGWAPYLLALLTFALFAFPLVALIDKRRAFLRRKPPLVAPHRTRLIREANEFPMGPREHFAEIRKALQRREPMVTSAIDVDATLKATLAEASGRVVPRYAAMRSAAEYLVLIDRRGLNDLEAERAWKLIEPLRSGAIGFDIFWFHSDPGWCTPEQEGPAVRIEELAARFPHHRLLLLGSGIEMIDLFSARARGGYAVLGEWARRGLLTPVAVSDWAREEWLITRAFRGPLGRSTSGGLMALAQHLLADMSGRAHQPFPDGDEHAPPLPEILLIDPLRFTGDTAPAKDMATGDDPVDDLLAELSWYPDRGGFVWLCALAVYPAVTFDLALFLGERLREQAGDAPSSPLLNARRLAALTQLPWLRNGRIPNWLRLRLLAELSPTRADEVRALIRGLIEQAGEGEEQANPKHAQYGREDRKIGHTSELYDDEVLVQFLLEGETTDFEFLLPKDKATAWERIKQADWLKIGAVLIALAYALAAWWIVPKASDGPAMTSLWLPTAALLVAAALVAFGLRPAPVWWRVRVIGHELGPSGLVLAVMAAVVLAERFVPGGWDAPQVWGAKLVAGIGAFALLPLADWLSGRLPSSEMTVREKTVVGLIYALRSLATAMVALALVKLADGDRAYGFYWLTFLLVTGLVLFWRGRKAPPPQWNKSAEFSSKPAKGGRPRQLLRTGWPLLAGGVMLALLLVYMAGLRGGRTTLVEGQGYVPVIASSDDGLIAATREEGRAIRVWNASDPGAQHWDYKLPEDLKGEVIRLAVVGVIGDGSDLTPVSASLVAALSDGQVLSFDAPAVAPVTFIPPGTLIPGSIRLAMTSFDAMLVAGQTLDGVNQVRFVDGNDLHLPGSKPVSLPAGKARVTAVQQLGRRLYGFGAADGTLGIFKPPAQAEIQFAGQQREGAYLARAEGPNLPGGPRLIRVFNRPSWGAVTFLAVGDDGSGVAVALAENGRVVSKAPDSGMRLPRLALGPVVPWVAKRLPSEVRKNDGGGDIVHGRKGKGCKPDVVCESISCFDQAKFNYRYIQENREKLTAIQAEKFDDLTNGLSQKLRNKGISDLRVLAYLLATVEHYTSSEFVIITFQIDEETLRKNYGPDLVRNKTPWNLDSDDPLRFYGRGYVPFYGRIAYRKMGAKIGIDLEANPERASEPGIAEHVVVTGALDGLFTGKKLAQYFNSTTADWVGARKVFDGTDNAKLIANRAKLIYDMLAESVDLEQLDIEMDIQLEIQRSQQSTLRQQRQRKQPTSKY